MSKPVRKRVIVIGLDGFEPKLVEPMMLSGELPNLAKLRKQGSYSRVRTTYPAQTPVAWSSFLTGTNPGGHGIFDFLSRDPRSYLPILALTGYDQKNAFVPPKAVNRRQGIPFWRILSDAGIPSVVIRCPCTYPPEEINGQVLSGVGVPDLRGSLGIGTFYTTRKGVTAKQSEKVVHIDVNTDGKITSHLLGPIHPNSKEGLQFAFSVEVKTDEGRAILYSDGQPRELELQVGRWSEWLKVKFKPGLLQSVRGMVRYYLGALEPEVELYSSPINFDPESPLFPISSPAEYAKELELRLGMFHTLGMAEDHDGLINGRIDEGAFLNQCEEVMRERTSMMRYELDRLQEGFFFCLFDTPDRLQHMFWRYLEPDHPANSNGHHNEWKSAIREHYQACDAIVGEVMNYSDPSTLFIVLSDHGMNSFQRGVNLNTWLYEQGFLALKDGVQPGEESEEFFRNVDWSRTQAYALGLGGIFLNRQGREGQGILTDDESRSVTEALRKGLVDLCDPDRGQRPIRSVMSREQMYSGPYVELAPDLLVNFIEGYRVSWKTPLGGVPDGLFEDNKKKWAGDHVVDPEFVPGVLFMNREILGERPRMVDLAPTILDAFGLSKTPAMEGDSLIA